MDRSRPCIAVRRSSRAILWYRLAVELFGFVLPKIKIVLLTLLFDKAFYAGNSLPITPRYAPPATTPASFARVHVYRPASLSRTFEISRSPDSNIWVRPVISMGIESIERNQNQISGSRRCQESTTTQFTIIRPCDIWCGCADRTAYNCGVFAIQNSDILRRLFHDWWRSLSWKRNSIDYYHFIRMYSNSKSIRASFTR